MEHTPSTERSLQDGQHAPAAARSAADFSGEDNKPLRPFAGELRVARAFCVCKRRHARPHPCVRPGDGLAGASEWGHERCVTAQGLPIA